MNARAAEEIETYTFEAAMAELERIVRRLEGGTGDLESAIADYARGAALQQLCQKRLEEARLKVEAVMKAADGSLTLQPFDTRE